MTRTVAPPPDFSAAGPLAEVASEFSDHITIECRRAWTAPGSALVVSTDGTFRAKGFPAAHFEPDGLRALLIHFNDDFPRAAPVLSKLSAATFAAVWRELYTPTDEPVKVYERRGAVYSVSPPSYTADIGALVREVVARLPADLPAYLTYAAARSTVALTVGYENYNVLIEASDLYGGDGVTVAVLGKDGTDYGDPLPDVRKRRRQGTSTVTDGVLEKIEAAAQHYHVKSGKGYVAHVTGENPGGLRWMGYVNPPGGGSSSYSVTTNPYLYESEREAQRACREHTKLYGRGCVYQVRVLSACVPA